MSTKISGSKYAAMYGPTTGDKVRLADTSLVIEVEKDYTTYGDEVKFGGGKTIRDGMGQSVKTCSKDGDLDLVITNALIVDSTGIVKADIGIKDGKIAGIGKAGNPDIMDGVTLANKGDRPVQVGSHFHFFEVNKCLSFDREKAYGYHLDIPSGTSVRFEPGEEKEVQLTEMGGRQRVFGLNDLTRAQATDDTKAASMETAKLKGFL